MIYPEVDTSHFHSLWAGDCSRLGDAHPLEEEEIYPTRRDQDGFAVIRTDHIFTDRTWLALGSAVLEAAYETKVHGVVIEFNILAAQVGGKSDNFLAILKRAKAMKHVIALVHKAYGSALAAALSCTWAFAASDCRTGLLRCDWPFVTDENRNTWPDLGHLEAMLREDVAKVRPNLSRELLERMTLRSIDVVDSVREGVVDGLAVDVVAAIQQTKKLLG